MNLFSVTFNLTSEKTWPLILVHAVCSCKSLWWQCLVKSLMIHTRKVSATWKINFFTRHSFCELHYPLHSWRNVCGQLLPQPYFLLFLAIRCWRCHLWAGASLGGLHMQNKYELISQYIQRTSCKWYNKTINLQYLLLLYYI